MPYHGLIWNKPEADGLAFSYTPKNETDYHVPASLQNILAEVEEDVYGCKFEDMGMLVSPNLEQWAKQGVLLLNTALTTTHGVVGAHTALWRSFIQYIIQYLNANNPGLIWMLWGSEARDLKLKISNTHYILEAGHPSPNNTMNNFRGCKHFSKANTILTRLNGDQAKIIW